MTQFVFLLILNITVLLYVLFFGLWALDYLDFPQNIILGLHLIGTLVSLYLLVTFISHAFSNKTFGKLEQAGWLFFLLGFSPISWLVYLVWHRQKFITKSK
jgi:Na+/proline symporter